MWDRDLGGEIKRIKAITPAIRRGRLPDLGGGPGHLVVPFLRAAAHLVLSAFFFYFLTFLFSPCSVWRFAMNPSAVDGMQWRRAVLDESSLAASGWCRHFGERHGPIAGLEGCRREQRIEGFSERIAGLAGWMDGTWDQSIDRSINQSLVCTAAQSQPARQSRLVFPQ